VAFKVKQGECPVPQLGLPVVRNKGVNDYAYKTFVERPVKRKSGVRSNKLIILR
jgi:hypothetical protein